MEQVPKYLVFLLGGGMALLLLKESVAFVKWAVKAIAGLSGKASAGPAAAQTVSQGNVEQKVNVEQGGENPGEVKAEVLSRIFECTSQTNAAVGLLAVEVGRLTERVSFMAGKQGEQNGDVKALTAAVSEMKTACAKRLLNCEKRFSGLHEKVLVGELGGKRED